jgi:GntR family transcriptional regulator, transcriptional repressor for pyruvate dehydrogenase complex
MNEELIQVLATATHIACKMITSPRQAALQASFDQACGTSTGVGWERKAAAHAEFFTALADAAGDSQLTPVFNHGVRFAYDLMIAAGPAANGIVTNSRKRMLAHLRAGDAEQAALEMEGHLRILHLMGRLAAPPASRAAAQLQTQQSPVFDAPAAECRPR